MLSPVMVYLGSGEEPEIETYMAAYNRYFDVILETTDTLVAASTRQAIALDETDVTTPILKNLHIKLEWIRLGFHPTNEPRVRLSTPFPLFTPLVMPTIMVVWNGRRVGAVKSSSNQKEADFGSTIVEVSC